MRLGLRDSTDLMCWSMRSDESWQKSIDIHLEEAAGKCTTFAGPLGVRPRVIEQRRSWIPKFKYKQFARVCNCTIMRLLQYCAANTEQSVAGACRGFSMLTQFSNACSRMLHKLSSPKQKRNDSFHNLAALAARHPHFRYRLEDFEILRQIGYENCFERS